MQALQPFWPLRPWAQVFSLYEKYLGFSKSPTMSCMAATASMRAASS